MSKTFRFGVLFLFSAFRIGVLTPDPPAAEKLTPKLLDPCTAVTLNLEIRNVVE